MAYVALAARCLIGLVFAVSAASKLRSGAAFRDFASWLAGLPVLTIRGRRAAAPVIVAAEVAVVVLAALPWTVRAGLVLAAIMLALFAAGVVHAVCRGASAPCQCFGTGTAPLGYRHAVRNVLLCGAAVAGAAGAAPGPVPAGAGVALSLVAAAVVAALVLALDDIAAIVGGSADLPGTPGPREGGDRPASVRTLR